MIIAIPYIQSGEELKYCLRGIEKYCNMEVVVIGDPVDFKVKHIPFEDNPELRFKERNIFQKLLLLKEDFIYFNDDHFLLKEFTREYHYSGTLNSRMNSYGSNNNFRKTLQNTIDLYGDMPNYFRHQPFFIERDKLEALTYLNWDRPWGYCLKSIYAFLNSVQGIPYPDLKIWENLSSRQISEMIDGREYFSTSDHVMTSSMIAVLNSLYPHKSRFE